MGKMYCTECGTELDSSAKFCSKCGTSVNNNLSASNDDSVEGIMERLETNILIIGVVILIVLQLFGVFTKSSYIFGVIIAPFIVGYLSNESIKLVMVYAVLLAFVSFILYSMFPMGFIHIETILMLFVFSILFSFVGNLIKIKLKS